MNKEPHRKQHRRRRHNKPSHSRENENFGNSGSSKDAVDKDGFGPHWKKQPKKLDPRCQEATPELLRIEIDNIFKDFLADPDQKEYIFPSDLNNLQRKYIHDKAQKMNIISKSYGKEPNRHLHIKKKDKQLASKYFQLKLSVGAQEALQKFNLRYKSLPQRSQNRRAIKRYEKVYGKLLECSPVVPKAFYGTPEIILTRKSLPIFERRQLVIDAINNNQIVIISSETGSGKTTQVPQYILEDFCERNLPCKIVCTQPRRISTVAAAERVSYERGDVLGGTIGYHIRLEQKSGLNTNIIYCTVGVFLRNLMCGSQCLSNITHVIIDEIHERDKLSDFLLICLKQNLHLFPYLRIILMSATVNTKKFEQYFGSGVVLSIPGRLHPIETYFLEDILHLLQYYTPKMREAAKKEKTNHANTVQTEKIAPETTTFSEMPEVDCALDEYLNFSENYDYKIHYEEATAQLNMYFIGEDIPVDYQHSQSGLTALMIAAYLGDKEFVSRLCNMSASLEISDKLGRTAFDYATLNGSNDIIRLLEFIKSQKDSNCSQDNIVDEAHFLLKLYDKTTTDDLIDYDLIVKLIEYIHNGPEKGSILVFLPGYDDIMMCNDRILDSRIPSESYRVFFLHSSMNIKDQCDVFKSLPNQRKIILSTNIAETSITIEDVVFVIDVGKAKEKVYDSYNKLSALQTQWISQACAKQRSGRAGRVRRGYCFRLYSQQRYNNMDTERTPEILRVSLEELCLHAKIIAPPEMNINEFLALAPDPPSANSIKVAIEHLQALGALDREEDLTMLGEYLSQLTVEPKIGKMLIWGVMFQCLEPILTLAAALAHKDPFQLPPQANLKSMASAKRKELTDKVLSDQLIYLKVFQKWQEETYMGRSRSFCEFYFVSEATLTSVLDTRRQLLGQLRAAGFIHNAHSIEEFNTNCHSWPIVKAAICAAFYPNIAFPNGACFSTKSEKKVHIHNTSVCNGQNTRDSWIFFDELVKNRINFSVRGATVVTPMTVALMCGIDILTDQNCIAIDEFVEFDFDDREIVQFRVHVDNMVRKILENPWNGTNQENSLIISTLCNILESEELKTGLLQATGIGSRPKFFTKLDCFENRRSAYNRYPNNLPNRQIQNQRHVGNNQNNYPAYKKLPTVSYKKTTTENSTRNVPNRVEHLNNGLQHLNIRGDNACALLDGLYNDQSDGEDTGATCLNYYQDSVESNLSTLNINNERFGEYSDNPMYILIRVSQKKNVDIAAVTNKWVFSPQTEKKILHFVGKGKKIFLIYYVKELSAFMGVARFVYLMVDQSLAKPTAKISWIINSIMSASVVRHLQNPYDNMKSLHESADGAVIEYSVAEEMVRIFMEWNVRH